MLEKEAVWIVYNLVRTVFSEDFLTFWITKFCCHKISYFYNILTYKYIWQHRTSEQSEIIANQDCVVCSFAISFVKCKGRLYFVFRCIERSFVSPLLVSFILTPSFIRYCVRVFAYLLQIQPRNCSSSNETFDQSDRPMFYAPVIETNVEYFHVLIAEFPLKLQHQVKIFYTLLLRLPYLFRGL